MLPICRAAHSEDEAERIVAEAIDAVLSTVDLTTVLERTGKLLRRHFGTTRVTINRCCAAQPGEAEVVLVDDPRHASPELGTRFVLAGSASGQAIATRRPFVADPIASHTPALREAALVGAYGYGSLASFPLIFEGEVLGTLDIAHMPDEGLLACCMRTAEQVSHLVAIALHNSVMVDEVRRLNRLLEGENTQLRHELRLARGERRYIAESPSMRVVLARLRLASSSSATVLIRGETGTGKEGLARLLHDESARRLAPYVVVNVGAIPETLIESELFGHEKGAFTGAIQRQAGCFEQADGGTIFLDEIGDAPLAVQVKLLRVLQEREFVRVGGSEVRRVDVRVVAATNRDLERMVESGAFRADLYYRLNIFPLLLPPLRERPEDLLPLARYFVARQAAMMHHQPPVVADGVLDLLRAYDWPGNVRELQNYLEHHMILSGGAALVLSEPPGVVAAERGARPGARVPSGVARPLNSIPRFDDGVRELLGRALRATSGKIYGEDGAAARLGLKPTTLQGKLKKYGITA